MKAKKTITLFVMGTLIMSLMAGCGTRGDNMVDEEEEEPAYEEPVNNNPSYNNPGYNNPGYTNPGTSLPVALTATVVSKETKAGGFLWLKKYIKTVTVQVNNPSQQQAQATLKVTFTKGGESVGTDDQAITLAPGATQTYTITPTVNAEDATAYAESLPTNTGTGTGTGWGNI